MEGECEHFLSMYRGKAVSPDFKQWDCVVACERCHKWVVGDEKGLLQNDPAAAEALLDRIEETFGLDRRAMASLTPARMRCIGYGDWKGEGKWPLERP